MKTSLKRRLRNLTAFMLTAVMLFGIVTPLSASANVGLEDFETFDNYISTCGTYSSSSFMAGGIKFTLRISDEGNGFITIYEYQDDQLIRSGIVYDNQNDRMYITTFAHIDSRGDMVLADEDVFVFSQHSTTILFDEARLANSIESFNASSSIFLGNITFRNMDNVTNVISVSFRESRISTNAIYVPPSDLTLLQWAGLIMSVVGLATTFINPVAFFLAKMSAAITIAGTVETSRSETFEGVRFRNVFQMSNPSAGALDRQNGEFEAFRYVVALRSNPSALQTLWPLFDPHNSMSSPWRTRAFGDTVASVMFTFM